MKSWKDGIEAKHSLFLETFHTEQFFARGWGNLDDSHLPTDRTYNSIGLRAA